VPVTYKDFVYTWKMITDPKNDVVGRGAGSGPVPATTASAAPGDPGVLAMLQAERNGRGQSGRVIAL
jgi:hypothetical protein